MMYNSSRHFVLIMFHYEIGCVASVGDSAAETFIQRFCKSWVHMPH